MTDPKVSFIRRFHCSALLVHPTLSTVMIEASHIVMFFLFLRGETDSKPLLQNSEQGSFHDLLVNIHCMTCVCPSG